MIAVKICGIKTSDVAQCAAESGADFLGFIFFDRSCRYIEPSNAARICREVSDIKRVGVFVDEDSDTVNRIAERVGLDYVQLHGNETADYAARIERPIIKAWRFGDNFDVRIANAFPCDIILLDSYVRGQAGGTGQLFNWTAAAIFQPYGADVSGSLEVDGVKSPEKIREFMRVVRAIGGLT